MADQGDLFEQPLAANDDAAVPSNGLIGAETPNPLATPPSDAATVPASPIIAEHPAAAPEPVLECIAQQATRKRGSVRLHLSNVAEPSAGTKLPAPDTANLPTTVLGCIAALERSGRLPAADRQRFEDAVTRICRIAKVGENDLPAEPILLRPVLARTLPTATRSPAKPLTRARADLRDLLARTGWSTLRASVRPQRRAAGAGCSPMLGLWPQSSCFRHSRASAMRVGSRRRPCPPTHSWPTSATSRAARSSRTRA